MILGKKHGSAQGGDGIGQVRHVLPRQGQVASAVREPGDLRHSEEGAGRVQQIRVAKGEHCLSTVTLPTKNSTGQLGGSLPHVAIRRGCIGITPSVLQ